MDYPELLKGYKNELVKLQEILLKERENRETDEHNAIELLTKVKEQYDLRFDQIKSEYEERITELEREIEQLNDQLNQLQKNLNDQQCLNQQLVESEKQLKTQKQPSKQNLNEKKIENENKSKQQNETIQRTNETDNDKLDTKLTELENYKSKIEELEVEIIHKGNEISNLKLDLRMAERETTRNKDQTKFLRESNRELKDKIANLEEELKKIGFKETSVESEMNSLKNLNEDYVKRNEQLQARLKTIEDKEQSLVDQLNELKCLLKNKENAINKHRETNTKLKNVLENIDAQNEKLQANLDEEMIEREKCMNEVNKQLKTINLLNCELQNYKSKLELANKQISSLKEQYEDKQSSFENKNNKYLERIDELESQLANELEKNASYLSERKQLEQDCFEKENEIRQSSDQINELIDQLNLTKEECSRNLTESEEWKKKSHSLAKMYDDLYKKYTQSKNRISTLLEDSDAKTANFEREKIRYEETLGQQTKLIELLLESSDKTNAKKSWFSIGKSDNAEFKSPGKFSTVTKMMKENQELQSAVEREKHKNEVLKKKISELERCQNNKRKNDHKDDNKKLIKTQATAPSVTEDETTSIKSIDLQSEQTNLKTPVKQTTKQSSITDEEEFTFTDSIMEELAYKDN